MEALLRECEIGHLALSDGSQPYVVPINYAYLGDKIVFHCAIKGRKLDLIRSNPACCFAVNRRPDRIAYHGEKRCHYRYQSVLVFGRACFVDDAGERLSWLTRFRDHFSQHLGWTIPPELDLEAVKKVGIVVIDIDEMTGRKEKGQDEKAVLSEPLSPPPSRIQTGIGVKIREATNDDLPEIVSIYNHEVLNSTSTFDNELATVEKQRAWLERHDSPRHPVIVAASDRKILGWASLSPWSDRCAYARAAEISVYVHPDHRGNRVGESLLRGLIDRGRSAGLGVLLARVCTEGEASLRLHKKMGFGHIGTMRQVGEKFGRLLDVAILDLHLGTSA